MESRTRAATRVYCCSPKECNVCGFFPLLPIYEYEPSDEPVVAGAKLQETLDTHTRTSLHAELVRIRAELGQTVILVTHDLEEAVTLSDRVIVLSAAPSRILLDEHIDLPHPRDVYSVREQEQFAVHHRAIWQVLGRQFRMTESQ